MCIRDRRHTTQSGATFQVATPASLPGFFKECRYKDEGSECVAQPFDARWLVEHDADNIEARIPPRDFGAPRVVAGGALHAPALLRIHRRLGRGRRCAENRGRIGEDLAHRFLRARGCTVVARNYRTLSGSGEIDLVVWDGRKLAFIEVKTRGSEG